MARKIIAKEVHGRVKIFIIDFWRDHYEPAIDVEVYVSGKFRYKP